MQYGLNYIREVSYSYDPFGKITGYASTSNRIGTSEALARLNQSGCYGVHNKFPNGLHERVYHACGNEYGLHTFPNRYNTFPYLQCNWELLRSFGADFEIHFGFAPQDCDTESPTKTLTNRQSRYPTKYPTASSGNNPLLNPTFCSSDQPTKYYAFFGALKPFDTDTLPQKFLQ